MEALAELAAQLTATAHLPPAARYHALRGLAPHLKAAIAAEQDAAVAALCDTGTYDDAATQLGVTASEVNRRVTAHRKRVGAEPRRGRKPAKPDA